jgi:hypothetical protein
MKAPAVLMATARLRPGCEENFAAWQIRHNAAIAKFPGFISSDMLPPGSGGESGWTILLNFQTPADLETWQKSRERGQIVGELLPLVEGGTLGERVQIDDAGRQPGSEITEVILSKIKEGKEDMYRAWAVRIQLAQAKFPGYRGTYLQPPSQPGDTQWTTLLRFDTAEHLEAWMTSPERAKLLAESKEFIEREELMRLATAFPGWVPVNPMTGKGPPNWKTAMLVLLGLFPIVMLELRFLSPQLKFLNSSLATFIGNTLSVSATSFITMPLFVRWFGWWLFPEKDSVRLTLLGAAILVVLFTLEIALLWRLLPW